MDQIKRIVTKELWLCLKINSWTSWGGLGVHPEHVMYNNFSVEDAYR